MSDSAEGPADTPAIEATLIVTAGTYVDRSLPTASWTNTHELQPGEYPLSLCSGSYHPTPTATRPYYARAVVPTLLTEEYRVNRFFTASSSFTTHPNRPSQVSACLYGYELRDGLTVLKGHGTVRILRDHPDRHNLGLRTPSGDIWWEMDGPIDQVSGTCGCGGWKTGVAAPDTVRERFAVEHLAPVAAGTTSARSSRA